MQTYLMFESRDPFEAADVPRHCELAERLAAEGNPVTFFLVQNGVLAARRSSAGQALTRLADAGVEVLADEFSLGERGIPASRLVPGVKVAPIDVAVDRLAAGCKALWL